MGRAAVVAGKDTFSWKQRHYMIAFRICMLDNSTYWLLFNQCNEAEPIRCVPMIWRTGIPRICRDVGVIEDACLSLVDFLSFSHFLNVVLFFREPPRKDDFLMYVVHPIMRTLFLLRQPTPPYYPGTNDPRTGENEKGILGLLLDVMSNVMDVLPFAVAHSYYCSERTDSSICISMNKEALCEELMREVLVKMSLLCMRKWQWGKCPLVEA